MKKSLLFLVLVFFSVQSYSQKSPQVIGRTFTFYDGTRGELNCSECDPIWEIKFVDKSNAILISRQANKSSEYGSCRTSLKYKYNVATKTITILELNNNNVTPRCLNMFIGDWQWKKGRFFDMRFYSKLHPDCDFS
jgi:hypothetical protein